MPRKSKLTKELISKISELLVQGNCINWVCDYVNINEATFYGWLKDGEEDLNNRKNNLKTEFFKAIKESRAQAQIEHVRNIKTASYNNPKWSAWFLERSDPKNWAEKKILDANITEHKSIEEISTDELKKLILKMKEETNGS